MKNKLLAVILCMTLTFTCGLFLVGCDLFGKPEPSSGNDVKNYVTETLSDMATTWSELENDYDVSSYLERYNAIKASVQSATTKKAVDDQKTLFNELTDEIKSGSNPDPVPDDVKQERQSLVDSFEESWTMISACYKDVAGTKYEKDFNDLLERAKKAESLEELSSISQALTETIQQIRQNLELDETEYARQAKSAMDKQWQSLLSSYDSLSTVKEFTDRYAELSAMLDGAKTEAEVNDIVTRISQLFNEIYDYFDPQNQPISQDTKDKYVIKMKSDWQTILSEYTEIAGSEYQTKFDKLVSDMQLANTVKDAAKVLNDFDALSKEIEQAYGGINACKNSALEAVNKARDSLIQQYQEAGDDVEFKPAYENTVSIIQSALTEDEINDALEAFFECVNSVEKRYEQARVDATKQLYINDVQEKITRFYEDYAGKIDESWRTRISELSDAFNNSKTVLEVENNKNELISYIDSLIERLNSEDSEELISAKQVLLSSIPQLYSNIEQEYLDANYRDTLTQTDEVRKAETALREAIENAKSVSELNALEKGKFNEFNSLLKKVALNSAVAQNKAKIEEIYAQYSDAKYQTLKNNLLLVADSAKNVHYASNFLYYCVDYWLEAAITSGSPEIYHQLAMYYSDQFNEKILSLALKNAKIDDLNTYMKSAVDFNDAENRFNTIKAALEAVKDVKYVKDVELTVSELSVLLNTTKDSFIKTACEQISLIVTYSDDSQTTLKLTESNFTETFDFSKVGRVSVPLSYTVDGDSYRRHITVSVVPDVANAKLLGVYTTTGVLRERDWNSTVVTTYSVYDNNYIAVKTADRENAYYYRYERKNDAIIMYYENYDYHPTELTVVALALNDADKTVNFYYPNTQIIIRLNIGNAELPGDVTVYGPYTGKGTYFALIGSTYTAEDISLTCLSTLCEFDKENKHIRLEWIKTDPNKVNYPYTWDENDDGTEGYNLRYDLSEAIKNATTTIQNKWKELIDQGYDVSYFEEDYRMRFTNFETLIMHPSQIDEILISFDAFVKQIKSNHYYSHDYSFDRSNLPMMKQGENVEDFINNNFVGKTLKLFLVSGINEKTVKITRSMVTYVDYTEQGGYHIEVSISYDSEAPYEGYQVRETFTVNVDMMS